MDKEVRVICSNCKWNTVATKEKQTKDIYRCAGCNFLGVLQMIESKQHLVNSKI